MFFRTIYQKQGVHRQAESLFYSQVMGFNFHRGTPPAGANSVQPASPGQETAQRADGPAHQPAQQPAGLLRSDGDGQQPQARESQSAQAALRGRGSEPEEATSKPKQLRTDTEQLQLGPPVTELAVQPAEVEARAQQLAPEAAAPPVAAQQPPEPAPAASAGSPAAGPRNAAFLAGVERLPPEEVSDRAADAAPSPAGAAGFDSRSGALALRVRQAR